MVDQGIDEWDTGFWMLDTGCRAVFDTIIDDCDVSFIFLSVIDIRPLSTLHL